VTGLERAYHYTAARWWLWPVALVVLAMMWAVWWSWVVRRGPTTDAARKAVEEHAGGGAALAEDAAGLATADVEALEEARRVREDELARVREEARAEAEAAVDAAEGDTFAVEVDLGGIELEPECPDCHGTGDLSSQERTWSEP
jgi:hypothetical protein